jgi:hypothetical protein
MKKQLLCLLIISLFLPAWTVQAQNQTNKWYFGFFAGLDFATNPPTVLINSAMNAAEGCATRSDASGNLLFYSNGVTVWNQNHVAMTNGLSGNISSAQGVLIEKQPGNSNLYYIFTANGANPNPLFGVNYSIVDMSLAAGMGSVTTANVILAPQTTERLTSTRHCNGIDTWIISHDYNTAGFKAFLLTAAGVNSVAVVSPVGPVNSQGAYIGCMKISPNGKKLAVAAWGPGFHVYDFDNSTGIVSNSLALYVNPAVDPYGIEFSVDGTKVYGSTSVGKSIYQWDICAGSDAAIVASQYPVYTSTAVIGSLQRASNGKIYVARVNQPMQGVINTPNLAAGACSYVDAGISIAPKNNFLSLPNFNWPYKYTSPPFTYTLQSCGQVAFTNAVSLPAAVCQNAATYSLTNQLWDFGDPASGSANASTLGNPAHLFSAAGTYTTQLILYYSCGGGTDTLRQVVTIANPVTPAVSVSGIFIICAGSGQTYTASGANTYSWSTGVATQSMFAAPAITTAYTVTGTTTGGCSAQKIFTVAVSECVGIYAQSKVAAGTVRIFPNPNSHYVYVECASEVSVSVIDQQGRVLMEQAFEAGTNKLDMEHLSNGLYFLRTVSASGITTGRLVKTSE